MADDTVLDTIPDDRPRDPRMCTAMTKKGTPCRTYVQLGTELCIYHSGDALKTLDPVKAQQTSARNRKERTRIRKLTPMQRLEETAAAKEQMMVDRLFHIIENGTNDTHVLRGLEMVFNRLYGKPEQRIETTSTALDDADTLDGASLAELMARLDEELKEAAEDG